MAAVLHHVPARPKTPQLGEESPAGSCPEWHKRPKEARREITARFGPLEAAVSFRNPRTKAFCFPDATRPRGERRQRGPNPAQPGSRERRAAAAGSGSSSRRGRPPLPARAEPPRPTDRPRRLTDELLVNTQGKAGHLRGRPSDRLGRGNLRPGATQLQRPPLAGDAGTETKWRRRHGELCGAGSGGLAPRAGAHRPVGLPSRLLSLPPSLPPALLALCGAPRPRALRFHRPLGFCSAPAPLPLYAWPGSSWIPNRLGSRCPAELDPAPCRSQHTHLEVVTAPKFPWMCSHYIWAKKSACHCFTKAAQFPAAATRPVPPLPKKPTP